MSDEVKTYECAKCKNVYQRTRTHEEMMQEVAQEIPETLGDKMAIVCDDCYQLVMGWYKESKGGGL